ncbi:MAG TPA: FAD-binding oxidoreductase [Candidatus Methylomirabilis sp.]|nr:FAD-binding oxidoreductase [Candidatus Methylomirabilis sp.]
MLDRLRNLVGPAHVLSGVECSPYVLEGRTPEAVVFPGSKEEVGAVVTLAGEQGVPVLPCGGGTALGIGAPPKGVGIVLGLKRLNRVLEHEPGDLTATVEAGITLDALQAHLGHRGQWLSLDPSSSDRATLGGILASNAAGPRRHLYGTCRDLLIGVTVVGADGTLIRGGGKVVKNVAGYDLPKLFIGSFGTLGVLVEATLRLRPRPDEDRLVVARFERLADAGAAARAVMASDLIPSALELLEDGALRALGLGDGAALLFGVDGIRDQVEWQCGELVRLLTPLGLTGWRDHDGDARDRLWRQLGDLNEKGVEDVAAVMKVGVLPTQLPTVMEQAAAVAEKNGLRPALTAHAGIGIATAVLSGGGPDVNAVVATLTEWRILVKGAGGHAVMEWAPLPVKERVPVWDEPGPATRLMKSLKSRLDPRGILNPGRFVGGI